MTDYSEPVAELEAASLAVVTLFMQLKDGEIEEKEVVKIYDEIVEDFTIEEISRMALVLASLSADLISEWSESESRDRNEFFRKIALAKSALRSSS